MREEQPEGPVCMAFLLCTNPATTTRDHPIIGSYPICDRCNDKLDAIEAKVRTQTERED